MNYLLGILLALSSVFLIVLVLIQQGRGGGLAGAFGGMGGQSAFGTKAGDVFTKVTIGAATVWILLCVATVKYATGEASPFDANLGTSAQPAIVPGTADETTGAKTPPASPPPPAESDVDSKTKAENGDE